MNIENTDKVCKIMREVKKIEGDIWLLSKYTKRGVWFFLKRKFVICEQKAFMFFDAEEIELLINHKKQRIQKLEKELEEFWKENIENDTR